MSKANEFGPSIADHFLLIERGVHTFFLVKQGCKKGTKIAHPNLLKPQVSSEVSSSCFA